MPKLGLCCSQHRGFSGKSNTKDLLGKVGKVSNVLISHLEKKKNIISVLPSPLLFPFSPPALLFLLSTAAGTLCPAIPTAGKPPPKKFNKKHLPKPSDLKPSETPKCHSAVKVPSSALIFHVLLHARHRHHGQMSVIPKMSPEWGQHRDGIAQSRQELKQMPGNYNDGKGKATE